MQEKLNEYQTNNTKKREEIQGVSEKVNPAINPGVDPAFESRVQAKTPEWVKDAVFYQIFPDRFAKSATVAKPSNLESWDSPPSTQGYKGGDLVAIAEKIEYLSDLGINAIYLNPVFQSASNHRYHTHDYFQVDPLLGGNPALRKLLDVAHTYGIRVILDGVFNHCSRGFFQFNEALESGAASPYLDWFYFRGFPVQAYNVARSNYDAWWDLPALPKFNTNVPAVREFLWSVGRYWLEFGIDGWRLDVPDEINDDEFWREFRRQVKKVNPQAYICGEIWQDARRWLQGDQFDSVMNYLFTRACLSFFIRDLEVTTVSGTGYAGMKSGANAAEFAQAIEQLLQLYPSEITLAQLNLLDSHDTARFIHSAKGDESALRLATLFQMTYPGAPSIYYGDEIGLPGGKDPDSRRSFPWDEKQWNQDLRTYFKKAIAMRHRFPALRRGDYNTLYGSGSLYVFGRKDAHDKLIIALNSGTDSIDFPAIPNADYLAENSILVDIFGETNQAYRVGPSGQVQGLRIPARSGIVLQALKTNLG